MNASVVLVIGYSFLAISAYLVVRPGALDGFIEFALDMLWALAAVRVVIGVLLFLGSAYTRLPDTVRVIGIVIFVGGIVTPVLGPRVAGERWIAFARRHIRPLSLVSMALGAVLVYSAA